jgi:peptidoglycan/LPS O-acetylase OafA/YrhL
LAPPILTAGLTAGDTAAIQPAARVVQKDYTAEGLRGLAAVTVFFAHFALAFFPRGFSILFPGLQTSPAPDGAIESFLRLPLLSVLWNGNFAVCVFFVLSGFVLSQPYYLGNRIEALRDRYLRRYLRLSIPIAASVLIGYVLMKSGMLLTLAAAGASHSDWLKGYWTFTPSLTGAAQDALYRVIFLGEFRYNPPLWTMKLEFVGSLITFAFYALMPATGVWRKSLHYLTAVAAIGIFTGKDAIFYYAFLLGGLIWALPRPRGISSWALFAAGIGLGSFQYERPFIWMPDPVVWDEKFFYNVLGAFFLLWSLRSGKLDSLLAARPMRVLGRLSFSLYLTHFFVLSTFSCWLYLQLQTRVPRAVWAPADLLASFLVLLAVAYVFERLVDRNGIQFSRRFAAGPALSRPKET